MDENNKKSTYNKPAQDKYNLKNKNISIKFLHTEMNFLQQIEDAAIELKLSRQAWIKLAIIEKLQRDSLSSQDDTK